MIDAGQEDIIFPYGTDGIFCRGGVSPPAFLSYLLSLIYYLNSDRLSVTVLRYRAQDNR